MYNEAQAGDHLQLRYWLITSCQSVMRQAAANKQQQNWAKKAMYGAIEQQSHEHKLLDKSLGSQRRAGLGGWSVRGRKEWSKGLQAGHFMINATASDAPPASCYKSFSNSL